MGHRPVPQSHLRPDDKRANPPKRNKRKDSELDAEEWIANYMAEQGQDIDGEGETFLTWLMYTQWMREEWLLPPLHVPDDTIILDESPREDEDDEDHEADADEDAEDSDEDTPDPALTTEELDRELLEV